MAGVTAHGATFTFSGVSAVVAALSVNTPRAEIVDMTGINDPVGSTVMVATGANSAGSIRVDYIHYAGGIDPQSYIGTQGSLVFGSTGYSITKTAILESASTEVKTGDVVRGSLNFVTTDYTGS
jgi:hypothetical protein